jgi:hypothetical protein
VDFATTDRFCEDPAHAKRWLRARWTTPTQGFAQLDGRMITIRAQAVWHLDDGPLTYADFEVVPGSVAFNVAPGE